MLKKHNRNASNQKKFMLSPFCLRIDFLQRKSKGCKYDTKNVQNDFRRNMNDLFKEYKIK